MAVIALTDWLMVGAGCLHSGPFLSRCLLFRLYDIDCSLLVYHEPLVSISTHTEDNAKKVVSEAYVTPATTLFVHLSRSAEADLTELVEFPPTRLELSQNPEANIGQVRVHAFHSKLPIKAGWALDVQGGLPSDYPIEGTAYRVISPAEARNLWDTFSPQWSWSVWSVVVASNDGLHYDLRTERPWTLTAFDTDNGWHPTIELRLARKS